MPGLRGCATPVRNQSVGGLWFEIAYFTAFLGLCLHSMGTTFAEMSRDAWAQQSVLLGLGVAAISLFFVLPPLINLERVLELIRRGRRRFSDQRSDNDTSGHY